MENIKGTKTEANLQTAFAGESQARNKYTYYASAARKEGYVQIAKFFEETAGNEKEHAKIWFKLLHDGEVPSTEQNLKDAAAGENYEWTEMYAQFAKEAREEGSKTVLCSPAATSACGSVLIAATSTSARTRPRFAPSARIRRPISNSARRTSNPNVSKIDVIHSA